MVLADDNSRPWSWRLSLFLLSGQLAKHRLSAFEASGQSSKAPTGASATTGRLLTYSGPRRRDVHSGKLFRHVHQPPRASQRPVLA